MTLLSSFMKDEAWLPVVKQGIHTTCFFLTGVVSPQIQTDLPGHMSLLGSIFSR